MRKENLIITTLLSGAIIAAGMHVTSVAAAEEDSLGNNLSFPGMFLPDVNAAGAPVLRLGCTALAQSPSGPQSTLYDGYWLQKTEATWQAACTSAASATVHAAWGSNLIDGRLKAGKPIRVEMNLVDQSDAVVDGGYVVEKLTPDLLDRLATYGTNGTTMTTNYRVFDSGARLKIERCADAACTAATTIVNTVMSTEINSLGNIVYGFNWGTKGPRSAPTAGTYKITFTTENATIASTNGQVCGTDADCTYVLATLVTSGGGSGGGSGKGKGKVR